MELISIVITFMSKYILIIMNIIIIDIAMIAFPRVRCMFIYMFVSLPRACVVFVVKEVTLRHSRGLERALGQLMGMVRKI